MKISDLKTFAQNKLDVLKTKLEVAKAQGDLELYATLEVEIEETSETIKSLTNG